MLALRLNAKKMEERKTCEMGLGFLFSILRIRWVWFWWW